jgi:DNA polymerase III alpha subunit (gram-positive type)
MTIIFLITTCVVIFPAVNLRISHSKYFDSLLLARLLEPNLANYKLKYLLETLNLVGNNAHLADEDVNATCSLVAHCYKKAVRNHWFSARIFETVHVLVSMSIPLDAIILNIILQRENVCMKKILTQNQRWWANFERFITA